MQKPLAARPSLVRAFRFYELSFHNYHISLARDVVEGTDKRFRQRILVREAWLKAMFKLEFVGNTASQLYHQCNVATCFVTLGVITLVTLTDISLKCAVTVILKLIKFIGRFSLEP